MTTYDLGLADLVSLEDWQKIQHQFSDAFEITLRTIGLQAEPLSAVSRPNRLCSEIIPRIKNVPEACSCCILKDAALRRTPNIEKSENIQCPFGLETAVVSIVAVKDKPVAYIMIGPAILKARKAISEYDRDAKSIGISLEELMDALIEINVFSYSKLSGITALIKDTFSHMAQTGYHKKRLGEMAPEIVALDPVFSLYYEEKILRSLLSACTLALGADSGSVMTVDRKTNMLHIKVASKLSDEVVNNTNIKVGEGIAGLAVSKAESIILPKDESKNGLAKKMNRKDIQSSLIMPFSKHSDSDVYGVINLNVMRKNVDFSEKDIALVKELVHMAGIALVPLRRSAVNANSATKPSS